MSNDLTAKGKSVGTAIQEYQSAVSDFDRETSRLLGVNGTDLRCLEILISNPEAEITPRTIADELGITTGSVTTMLDRLEKAAYITRTRHASDRRKVLIAATPAARERTWSMIAPFLEDSDAEVVTKFTADELDIVERFITQATTVQRRHIERLRNTPRL